VVPGEEFTGNRSVSSSLGGTGAITNGQLRYTIGTPSELVELKDSELFYWIWYWREGPSFRISDSGARFAFLWMMDTSGDGYSGFTWRELEDGDDNDGSEEWVAYVFVDRNVTITGDGGTVFTSTCDECCGFTETGTLQGLNLNLRAGWNTVNQRVRWWQEDELTHRVSFAVSLGNLPHVTWMIEEWTANRHGHSEAAERSGLALPGRSGTPSFRVRR
ncbi:MAG: hypothetical protein FWD88_06905, partial [Treponema sp.]|nr:hypothetical protein [Treponema sp.]